MSDPLDAVVVGAGHNGLVAAAYLARAGLAVELLERREIVGGACVTEELWPGVRVSPGAYTLSLLQRQVVADLHLVEHGLRAHAHEPRVFAPLPDGRRVVTWQSARRTHTQLTDDWSAADAEAYADREDRLEAAAAGARPLMLEPPDRERWRAAIGDELLTGSIADDLAAIPSEPVRVPAAIGGLLGALAGSHDAGTAFLALYHRLGEATGGLGSWGYVPGGMGAVTAALLAAAERAGARVRLESPVERVLVEDGRATGVVTAGDREVRARAVLSNADPLRTAALAGVPPPPGWRQEGPALKVMLLLDGLPDFPAWPGHQPWEGTIDVGFTLDDLDAAAADARAGRPPAAPWIEASCQTTVDPTLAPGGEHVLALYCQCYPADTDAEAAADVAVARFAEVCPGLPDRVVDRLVLGPRELEDRFGLTGGHIFHGEMLPEQLLERRPGPRRFGGVEGLYLAGAGAHPGGAVSGAPGYLAARAVLEDLSDRAPAARPPGR